MSSLHKFIKSYYIFLVYPYVEYRTQFVTKVNIEIFRNSIITINQSFHNRSDSDRALLSNLGTQICNQRNAQISTHGIAHDHASIQSLVQIKTANGNRKSSQIHPLFIRQCCPSLHSHFVFCVTACLQRYHTEFISTRYCINMYRMQQYPYFKFGK